MDVSPPSLQVFRTRPTSRRQRSDLVTSAHIQKPSRLNLCSYGRPQITEELKEIDLNLGHRRAGRLMRLNSIPVLQMREHKVTKNRNHKLNIVPNLRDRDFMTDLPDQKDAGDVPYIWTREG